MRSFIIRYFILLSLFFPALAPAATPLNLTSGWNLLGNSSAAPIDVATTFGDATKITTVWKWNKIGSKWVFYAPSMTPSALTTYTQGKGYDVLTSIDPKEGFWVNASTSVALTGPVANGVMLVESDLQPGWNLMGSADNKTTSQLNAGLSSSLNAAGKAIVTAWAWDTPNTKWKFYAPSLEAQGGTVLADYITSKGYLPFSTAISASEGFWLNIGAATSSTYSISGTVTGAANVTVNLTGAAPTTTDANGNYTFTGLANGSYTVTPSWAGHIFSPVSTAINVNGANVTGKNTVATASTAATYCLTGTVTGAVVKNVTVFLNGNNTGSTVTDASGNYTFCGLVNGSYTVTAFLSGYSITTSSTITISGANPSSTNLVATVAPSGSSVVFVPLNPLPTATVGLPYNNTVVSSITTSGGTPPYHYQSDTFANGAPPMGLIVDLNGMLTGTPRVAGTYTFGVCAVDMVGSSSCKTTSIIVNPVLSVILAGTGSGAVTSVPGGISCGATCAAGIATGTTVTLTATPATGSTFTGWSGACSGAGSCIVTMDAVKAATASFTVNPTCSNGAADYPTCTPPTCSNGATDYPACTPPQSNVCNICTFDVYCSVYGAGGCWKCSNSTYSGGVCVGNGLASPGPCVTDPSIYTICQ